MAGGLLLAAGVLQGAATIYGNIGAAKEARAEEAWLVEQANFAQLASEREFDIFKKQAGAVQAEQGGQYIASGIDLSGSALAMLEQTKADIASEGKAIIRKGEMNVREAMLKASMAKSRAKKLGSFGYNLLSAAGPVISGASKLS